jgi:hypothetical protein
LLSLPPGTKMVHFPGFASHSLLYSGADIPTLLGILLQDSEIPRSQPVCGSLRLIAAYHVLHRLPSPRHPPYALSSLTIKFTLPETQMLSRSLNLWSTCFTRRHLIVKELHSIRDFSSQKQTANRFTRRTFTGRTGNQRLMFEPLITEAIGLCPLHSPASLPSASWWR